MEQKKIEIGEVAKTKQQPVQHAQTQQNLSAVANQLVKEVENAVTSLMARGGLDVPKDYSVVNALRAAALILQETVDKDKNPVLQSCTRSSIISSLLSMVVQGLNPLKNQCYFVAFAGKLTLMRSYAGNVLLAKRAGLMYIHARVVRKGDEFSFEINDGICRITKHVPTLETLNNEIVAAYAVYKYKSGNEEVVNTEIMTTAQLKQAWMQSYNFKENGIHSKFDEEMAKKTVISRACKLLINTSPDVTWADEIDEIAEGTAAELTTETTEPISFDIIQEESENLEQPKPEELEKKDVKKEIKNEIKNETKTKTVNDEKIPF